MGTAQESEGWLANQHTLSNLHILQATQYKQLVTLSLLVFAVPQILIVILDSLRTTSFSFLSQLPTCSFFVHW